MEYLAVQLFNGLVNGSFYALLSLGLAVIFGMMRIVNFAHGAFYMLGAFIASIGLALIWSLFIWLAFVMAIAWLIRLASMSWARMRAEAEAERRGASEVELPVTTPDAGEERRAS